MQLNHGIASARLRSPDEDRCHGWLRNRLFGLGIVIIQIILLGCRFLLFLIL